MIAIYAREGSFSDRWIDILDEFKISYILLDPFSNDISKQIKDNKITVFLMHPAMQDSATLLHMRNFIQTLENNGIKVFPSLSDYYTFDDKVSQKYIFELFEIAAPKTEVFFDTKSAIKHIEETSFPIVAKLNKGAGAVNVKLLKNRSQAHSYIKKAFSEGFDSTSAALKDLKNKIRMHKKNRSYISVLKRAPQTLLNMFRQKKLIQKERGFVLFQEFIPNNDSDIRVTIIGSKAFIFKRMVREGDFRASGSGEIIYDVSDSERKCLGIAFAAANRIGLFCVAFDFVYDYNCKSFKIIEFSYAFKSDAVYKCPGCWDKNGNFYSGNFYPERVILEEFEVL